MADKEYRNHFQDELVRPARATADKRARWMLLGCVLVVALPALYLARGWLPQPNLEWLSWKKQQAVETVIARVQSGDQHAAHTALIQAMKASPNDPNVLRAWAIYCKTYHGPAADRIVALKKLSESGSGTPADLVDLATAHLDNQEFNQAQRVLNSVPESERHTVAAMEVAARLAKASGDTQAGRKLARAAYESDRENPESQLKLASLQLAEPFPERQAGAIATLRKLAELPTQTGAEAIEILCRQPALTPKDTENLLKFAQQNSHVTPRQTYWVLSAVARKNPERKVSLIQQEAQRAGGLGLEDLHELALWLAREGEAAMLLKVVSQEKACSHPGLFKLFADALIRTDSWQSLQTILDTRKLLPISKGYAGMLRGLNAAHNGDTSAAFTTMDAAIHQAMSEQDAESILKISTWASDAGAWDIAIDGYTWLAAADPRYTRLSLELLYQAATGKRDGPAMIQAAQRMVSEKGAPLQAVQKLIYLRLVLGMEMETVEDLHQRYPRSPGTTDLRTTDLLITALTKYRLGDLEGVREIFSTATDDWSTLPAGQRAVAAVLLKVAGRQEAAIRLAQSVSRSLLLSEEKELIALAQLDDTLRR